MKNTSLISLASVPVAIFFIFFWHFELFLRVPLFYCEGIGCIGVALELIVIGLAGIPLVFGLLGYFLSQERKWAAGGKAFLTAFIAMVIAFCIIWLWHRYDVKKAMQEYQSEVDFYQQTR